MKAAKIAIIVLAPIVLVVGLIWSFSGKGSRPGFQDTVWVDVMSGEVVSEPKSGPRQVPRENNSGERVVFPAVRENGQLVIPDFYRSTLTELFKDKTGLKVDLSTYVVKPES